MVMTHACEDRARDLEDIKRECRAAKRQAFFDHWLDVFETDPDWHMSLTASERAELLTKIVSEYTLTHKGRLAGIAERQQGITDAMGEYLRIAAAHAADNEMRDT